MRLCDRDSEEANTVAVRSRTAAMSIWKRRGYFLDDNAETALDSW